MKLAWLRSQEGAHDDSVWAATWVPATDESPALLLTGSLDETVRLWIPQDLSLIRTNSGHCLGVVFVAAHPSNTEGTVFVVQEYIARVSLINHLTDRKKRNPQVAAENGYHNRYCKGYPILARRNCTCKYWE